MTHLIGPCPPGNIHRNPLIGIPTLGGPRPIGNLQTGAGRGLDNIPRAAALVPNAGAFSLELRPWISTHRHCKQKKRMVRVRRQQLHLKFQTSGQSFHVHGEFVTASTWKGAYSLLHVERVTALYI